MGNRFIIYIWIYWNRSIYTTVEGIINAKLCRAGKPRSGAGWNHQDMSWNLLSTSDSQEGRWGEGGELGKNCKLRGCLESLSSGKTKLSLKTLCWLDLPRLNFLLLTLSQLIRDLITSAESLHSSTLIRVWITRMLAMTTAPRLQDPAAA